MFPVHLALLVFAAGPADGAAVLPEPAGDPVRGYEVLRSKPLLPPDFDRETLLRLGLTWAPEERAKAKAAGEAERIAMAFSRYGLVAPPPNDPIGGEVLNYVETPDGWVMNCFACHGGKVAGRTIPGLPNSHYGLETLTEEVRTVKLLTGKPLGHQDLGQMKIPAGSSHGTTNAVVFGIVLDAFREPDMSVNTGRHPGPLLHHDMDAPPWWHLKKKSRLYIDGFSPKNHRVLMQFMLLPSAGRETVLSWEDDFRDVLAYIESVEAPPYPYEIDEKLAATGRGVFERNCTECHGMYADDPAAETYPELTVPIEIVGTDRRRLDALTVPHRRHLGTTWMSRYGEDPVVEDPGGYVAPPLDGVWATAPYFHNGSVPTLAGVLSPDERPTLWRRSEDGYDTQRVGLEYEEVSEVPDRDARFVFDTRRADLGKTNAGHPFAAELTANEKRALLEYLKTL
ncbi:c-type cytochrome [Alienimonas californiensis]|uniref:Cytochrome c n=1 Tax=Alienimonas californiensis TaxID=2527989 RepID=A0A517PD88_9PLAN|nr:cytochrome c [Alienimonas californiensis]QDT17342.1 Cytochrome c [Alienimonas californiensis]